MTADDHDPAVGEDRGSDPHVGGQLPPLLRGELAPRAVDTLERHAAGCDRCRRDLLTAAVTAARLGDAARLPGVADVELPPLRLPPSTESGQRRLRQLSPGVGIAAGLALLVTAGAGVVALTRVGDQGRSTPPAVTVALTPVGAAAGPAGRARVVGEGAERFVEVDASALPALPVGFYEVWLLDPPTTRLVALGVLPAGGTARFPLPPQGAEDLRTLDISAEPADGDPGHSGGSVLRGPLS